MRIFLAFAAVLLLTAPPASARMEEVTSTAPALSRLFSVYEPVYLLPAYYTFSPDNAVYGGTLPNNQTLNRTEVKFQISFKVAMASSGPARNAYVAYTQTSFWQVYENSAFFRETNYQPELLYAPNERVVIGSGWDFGYRVSPFIHQSNGRGGSLERSWDRTGADALFTRLDKDGDGWTADLRAWVVWRDAAYRRYNPDMSRYLGYFRPALSYRVGGWEVSVDERNALESGFRRGAFEAAVRRRLGDNWDLYAQYFNGYGQSLIEYNHPTNALGLGFAVRTQ
jgi:phospholipase A1